MKPSSRWSARRLSFAMPVPPSAQPALSLATRVSLTTSAKVDNVPDHANTENPVLPPMKLWIGLASSRASWWRLINKVDGNTQAKKTILQWDRDDSKADPTGHCAFLTGDGLPYYENICRGPAFRGLCLPPSWTVCVAANLFALCLAFGRVGALKSRIRDNP